MQCVIFDCDGTLVDSEFLCHLAMEIKLREHGVNVPAAQMMRDFRGWKLAEIINRLSRQHHFGTDKNFLMDDFVASYRSLVADLFDQQLCATPGMLEALSKIPMAMCVASSGPLEKIRQALAVTGLHSFFADNIFSAYSINRWKPEPDLFLHAAKTMGFETDACVVVEDSQVGIDAALHAGMQAILYAPEGAYAQCPAQVTVITHMNELPVALC